MNFAEESNSEYISGCFCGWYCREIKPKYTNNDDSIEQSTKQSTKNWIIHIINMNRETQKNTRVLPWFGLKIESLRPSMVVQVITRYRYKNTIQQVTKDSSFPLTPVLSLTSYILVRYNDPKRNRWSQKEYLSHSIPNSYNKVNFISLNLECLCVNHLCG